MSDRAKIISCFTILYLVWGSTFLAIYFSVQTIPPLLVGGFRHVIAGIVLFTLMRGFSAPKDIRSWSNAVLVGVLTAGISNGTLIVIEKTVPSGLAAITFACMPLMMLILNWFLFEKVRPSITDTIALILGILGIALVVSGGKNFEGTSLRDWEVFLLIIAPLFWAIGSLLSRRIVLPGQILLSSSIQMISGGTFLFILGTLHGDWPILLQSTPSAESLWGVVYLTIMGSLVGFSAFAYLIKNVDSRLVGTYAFINPLVAMGLGILWGENILSPLVIAGAGITLLSVATVLLARLGPAINISKISGWFLIRNLVR